jgi:hypothetical protein|tara:strand:+ start:657 stop:905 length:249 start_codon:yes stop_codon:yes gene_type:complete
MSLNQLFVFYFLFFILVFCILMVRFMNMSLPCLGCFNTRDYNNNDTEGFVFIYVCLVSFVFNELAVSAWFWARLLLGNLLNL